MLRAVKLFAHKVHYYQSGNIIGIIRAKNGFIKYAKEGPRYADIKLNILIRGKHNNIIGEIQFLLNVMKDFKDNEHDLYGIKRKKESIQNSVSKILPMMLNKKTKLFSAGLSGNLMELNKLMVIQNMTLQGIMKQDKYTKNTILHQMCKQNKSKSIKYLTNIISKTKMLEYLFQADRFNTTPIEYAIKTTSTTTIKLIFDINGVKRRYINDMDLLFRSIHNVFSYSRNEQLMDYILNVTDISPQKLIKVLEHKCKIPKEGDFHKNATPYHRRKIIQQVVEVNTLKVLKKLVSIIGKKQFIQMVFIVDDYNLNVMERAIKADTQKFVKYLLSFKEIKDKYVKDEKLLWRLLFRLFAKLESKSVRDYILKEFKEVKEQFVELMGKRYPGGEEGKFGKGAYFYNKYSIMTYTAQWADIENLKDLRLFVGDNVFCNAVFLEDEWGDNAIDGVVSTKKVDKVKYVLSVNKIKNKCMNDKDILHGIVKKLCRNFSRSVGRFIIKTFDLNEKKVNELKEYKDFNVDKILTLFRK